MSAIKLKPLAEQVVVITGASSGIGLVTARRLADEGASVVLVSRDEGALSNAVDGIVTGGGNAIYVVADVGNLDDVVAVGERAIAEFGRIDGWVNDAGVAIYSALVETPLDEHEALFRTNYFGAVNGAQVAVRHLRDKGGALVTIGSIAGDMPSPVMGAYAASKHAVKGYVESLRSELSAAGVPVSVTLIKPSGIDTPIAEHAAKRINGKAMIPPPVYDPELVADAILDALRHPRRNLTVGGVGRAQVLVANHFPVLFSRLGGLVAPLIARPGKPEKAAGNLQGPGRDGSERSGDQAGRSFSLYAARPRGIGAVVGVAAATGLAAALLVARRRARAHG